MALTISIEVDRRLDHEPIYIEEVRHHGVRVVGDHPPVRRMFINPWFENLLAFS